MIQKLYGSCENTRGTPAGSDHYDCERGIFITHHACPWAVQLQPQSILGVGHRRLFLQILRALLEQAGYEIRDRGVPAPFPLAIRTNFGAEHC
jgi:hypothetical protein